MSMRLSSRWSSPVKGVAAPLSVQRASGPVRATLGRYVAIVRLLKTIPATRRLSFRWVIKGDAAIGSDYRVFEPSARHPRVLASILARLNGRLRFAARQAAERAGD